LFARVLRVYSPPEIEAILLRSLKIAAEEYLGEPVEDAIVSVPAYFNDSQRQATKDAGGIAGLRVNRILNEATAAALTYGMSEKKYGLVAVYDLGGGTFDVSILELEDGIYQVLATAGDTYLGGQDFDELIVDWLVEEFRNEHDIDVANDRMALQRLKEAAEKAKCELSTQPQAEIALPFLSADSKGPKHLSTVLTRTRFEQMIQPMLDHTARLCESALRDAGLEATDIAEVIPVGGQTRTPAVLHTMKRIFRKEPDRSVNPDEAVAVGAAVQAGVLQGYVTDLVLLDVTPHTLGIETKDGTFTPLIERNANLPTKKGRLFTTVFDNQPDVEVHVLQGEGCTAQENTSLARFRLGPLSPAPAREPEIEVTFEIDVNGILDVTALDRATGRRQSVTVEAKSGLTPSEVESARIRIERRFDRNDDIRLLELLFGARILFDLIRMKLTEDERISAERTIRAAGATRGGPPDEIRRALQAIDRLMRKLTRTMPE
jgi:molecular chaperone DnaK